MFRLVWAIMLLERLLSRHAEVLEAMDIDDDVKLALTILKRARTSAASAGLLDETASASE